MHVRRSYDELDALKAINQVRDFMNGLSAKIGEKTRRPIRRVGLRRRPFGLFSDFAEYAIEMGAGHLSADLAGHVDEPL